MMREPKLLTEYRVAVAHAENAAQDVLDLRGQLMDVRLPPIRENPTTMQLGGLGPTLIYGQIEALPFGFDVIGPEGARLVRFLRQRVSAVFFGYYQGVEADEADSEAAKVTVVGRMTGWESSGAIGRQRENAMSATINARLLRYEITAPGTGVGGPLQTELHLDFDKYIFETRRGNTLFDHFAARRQALGIALNR